jgi:hypothetical protein
VIDSVSEDSDLTPEEKETTIHMVSGLGEMTVFSAEAAFMKRLLAHPEFEIDHIRQTTSHGQIDVYGTELDDEFDGRRRTVAVKGIMPVGVLTINAESRDSSYHYDVVSDKASDLRLSQRGD